LLIEIMSPVKPVIVKDAPSPTSAIAVILV
jgi:hypothetical protein